jgi:hypothetical protein
MGSSFSFDEICGFALIAGQALGLVGLVAMPAAILSTPNSRQWRHLFADL